MRCRPWTASSRKADAPCRGCARSPEHFSSLGEALAHVPVDLGLPSWAPEFQVVVEGQQRELTAGTRDELYRIGREAILNAFRHSRAKRIEAEIEYRASGLRIAVRDNGCGIDPEALLRKGTLGAARNAGARGSNRRAISDFEQSGLRNRSRTMPSQPGCFRVKRTPLHFFG